MLLAALLLAAPLMTPDECAVWNRELSFARTVEAHDAKAFASYLHPGAVFNAAGPVPTRGAEAVLKEWAGIIEGKDVVVRWRPSLVTIGADPDIAISSGYFTLERPAAKKYAIGWFQSVWKRTAQGVWQVLTDGVGAPPQPAASREALEKHLAQAPTSCGQ